MQHDLRPDVRHGEVENIGGAILRGMHCNAWQRGQLFQQVRTQRSNTLTPLCQGGSKLRCRRTHTGDQGHRLRAGAYAMLLFSAKQQGREPHALPHIQSPHALGGVDLVTAQGQQIRLQL